MIYENDFSLGKSQIPINGLVWMGDKELMLHRLKSKIEEGFTCIKLKIGGINFEDELDLLGFIRKNYSTNDIKIRLDANGAFAAKDALRSAKTPRSKVGQGVVLADSELKSPEQELWHRVLHADTKVS